VYLTARLLKYTAAKVWPQFIKENIMPQDAPKPFSQGYVLRTTAKHMRKSIDISIRKTFERVQEFADDQPKSQEVFQTLAFLHNMRKQLDDFQSTYSENFKGN
jgi:hypothetical protein